MKCCFCGFILGTGPGERRRAKEHVLKRSIIQKLNSRNPLDLVHFGKHGQSPVRKVPPISHVALEICKECNGGWINDVDLAVENTILSLARMEKSPADLTDQERFSLARWAFKTACTFENTMPGGRCIAPEYYQNASNSAFLPKGFICFASVIRKRSDTPAIISQINIGRLGVWLAEDDEDITVAPNPIKFGVQYGHIIIGCCWSSGETPSYIGATDVHIPLYTKGARYIEAFCLPIPDWPEGMAKSILHFSLIQMRLSYRQSLAR